MCGLAGLAFHPSSTLAAPTRRALLSHLLRQMAQRGRHATGLATGGAAITTPCITKLAVPADQFIGSQAYSDALDRAAAHPIWLGHTRHATHQNAHLDEAAHPYQQGQVVGAHNGIVYNWHDLMQTERPDPAWIVDSQAIFALLDKYKNPNKALDKLQGYWALTWIKRGRLYACRTGDAQLTFGYLASRRLLVWASTQDGLMRALRDATVNTTDLVTWEAKPNLLYEFDPDEFTNAPNHATQDLTFAGRRHGFYDTSRTDERALARRATYTPRTNEGPDQTTLPLRGVDPAIGKAVVRQVTDLSTPAGQFQALWNAVDRLRTDRKRTEDLLAEQAGEIETLKAEVEHLYEVLNEANIIDNINVPF